MFSPRIPVTRRRAHDRPERRHNARSAVACALMRPSSHAHLASDEENVVAAWGHPSGPMK